MRHSFHLTVITLLLAVPGLSAATLFVSLESTNPTPPYTNWVTAATNIQDAVDVAATDDVVVVTNGVYPGGISVTNPLTLLSVNGPQFTRINGSGTNQCVYLADFASLTGFTLTNGVGGVSCASANAFLTNCVIAGNHCPGNGGGASGGTLNNCTLTGNTAYGYWVPNPHPLPIFLYYVPGTGGGASGGTLNNCVLKGNSASDFGGGACGCTLNNCTLSGNTASGSRVAPSGHGGGASGGTLNNCTLTGNSAYRGGGASGCTLNNCLLFFNTAPSDANYDVACDLSYCCTTPLPPGTGNIATDPRLTDSAHISSDSPCVGAGNFTYVSGADIDGEAWANPPSIGCDEFHAGPVSGPLTVTVAVDYTNAAAGFVLNFTGQINGHALVNFWDFDDGTFAVNEACGLPHSFAVPGDYRVTLWAYNDSHPEGVSACLVIHVDNGLHYVSAASPNPVAPYASWATAATNLQDAVDTAGVGGTILVTNGTYASGGQAGLDSTTNRVVLDKPVTLRSVNGALFTIIDGKQAMRCAYLAKSAGLIGFTMTNGVAAEGAGVFSESVDVVVSNCVITGNAATSYGGGAYGGTLNNCTLSGNSGGGAYGGTLNNCTLSGNDGLGAYSCTLHNCIVYYNSDNYSASTLNYCCTTPIPTSGIGNITNAPLFVDLECTGGKVCLDRYDLTSQQLTVLKNQPINSDAVVVTSNNVVYLTSYYGSIPGESGGVSYLQPPYTNEVQFLHIEIAPQDMCIDDEQNIFIIGGSDLANANSLYRLPAGNYGSPVVLQTGLGRTWCIAKTASYLYFSDFTKISRFYEGGGIETFLNKSVMSMSFSSHYLYYADYFAGTIGRINLSTMADETLLSGLKSPKAVRFDRTTGNLYFVEFGSQASKYRDGTLKVLYGPDFYQPTMLASNLQGPNSLWVQQNNIYLTETAGRNSGFGTTYGGNLRLQSNSPCINSGNNTYAPGPTDLDGNPRIVSGTVDIGAYEFQGTGSVISYAWLQQYGLPTDGSADFSDPDGDGLNDYQEWRCLTVPTNALSALRMLSAAPVGADVSVTWQSVAGVNYFLECGTNLTAMPVFKCVGTNLVGQSGTTTCADTNAASLTPLFYRVGVGN